MSLYGTKSAFTTNLSQFSQQTQLLWMSAHDKDTSHLLSYSLVNSHLILNCNSNGMDLTELMV